LEDLKDDDDRSVDELEMMMIVVMMMMILVVVMMMMILVVVMIIVYTLNDYDIDEDNLIMMLVRKEFISIYINIPPTNWVRLALLCSTTYSVTGKKDTYYYSFRTNFVFFNIKT